MSWRRRLFAEHGAADILAEFESIGSNARFEAVSANGAFEAPDRTVVDGELIELNNHAFRVIETPGHTRGHVVYFDEDRGILFTGDHVLPLITPSIGFEAFIDGQPLGSFLTSLAKIAQLPAELSLPGHGPVFSDLSARVDELFAHHRGRLQACADLVKAGRHRAVEVARALTWTRHDRDFRELSTLNQLLAVSETIAHLDLLTSFQVLQRTGDAHVSYRPTGIEEAAYGIAAGFGGIKSEAEART